MANYYFRGTTAGYAGNATNQKAGVTCVSTDPRVATVFAIESSRFGSGVVHVVRAESIPESRKMEAGNWFALKESEVVLEMQIREFTELAEHTVSLEIARDVLSRLGCHFSLGVRDKASIDRELDALPPLPEGFANRFVMLCLGTPS